MAQRPFLVSPGPVDPLRDFRRALTVRAMAAVLDRDVDQVAVKLYGREAGPTIAKAAVAPVGTNNTGNLASAKIGPFIRFLKSESAAAQLFDLGNFIDLRGGGSLLLSAVSGEFPNAAWVAEGGPAPVFQGTLASVQLVPKKLVALSALTNELAEHGDGELAEQVISGLLRESAARALDAKIFSTDAATPVAPAGLLNGIAPIAGAPGGGVGAVAADLRALTEVVSAAGGGSNLVIIAAPPQAVTIQVLAGRLSIPVITGPNLPNGTVIVMDVGAFASAFKGDPEIDVAESAVIYLDDANPEQIGEAGVLAGPGPVRSSFQADMKVLRCILRVSYAMRTSAIAYTTTASW